MNASRRAKNAAQALLPLVMAALLPLGAQGASPADQGALGADALLQSLGATPEAPAANDESPKAQAAAQAPQDVEPLWQVDLTKLDNTYLKLLYSMWQTDAQLSRTAKGWVVDVLGGKFEQAVATWDGVAGSTPSSFASAAKSAVLYSLWKLPAPAAFITEWLGAMVDPGFASSRIGVELNRVVDRDFAVRVAAAGLILTPGQVQSVQGLPGNTGITLTLKAIAALRTGEKSFQVLQALPAGNPYILPLAQSVLLARAKGGNLAGAARILKQYVEPALRSVGDPVALAQHYMNVGRLLYQAGLDDAAEAMYSKVPNGVPQFIQAREELAWVFLRKGETEKLRGELQTLTSPLFEAHFVPDVPVLEAISHLERCYYDRIPGVLAEFGRVYGPMGKKIDEALASANPGKPFISDYFSKRAEIAQLKLAEEARILSRIPGALAAKATKSAQEASVYAKSLLAGEYRRQWKSLRLELEESIRKMHFVKIELMSRIQAPSVADSPSGADGSGARQQTAPKGTASVLDRGQRMVFPIDGIMWPDELFHMQAKAQSLCLQRKGTS